MFFADEGKCQGRVSVTITVPLAAPVGPAGSQVQTVNGTSRITQNESFEGYQFELIRTNPDGSVTALPGSLLTLSAVAPTPTVPGSFSVKNVSPIAAGNYKVKVTMFFTINNAYRSTSDEVTFTLQ
jgi:hypothetical protein